VDSRTMTASQVADGSHTFKIRVVEEVTRQDILANQTVSLKPEDVNKFLLKGMSRKNSARSRRQDFFSRSSPLLVSFP